MTADATPRTGAELPRDWDLQRFTATAHPEGDDDGRRAAVGTLFPSGQVAAELAGGSTADVFASLTDLREKIAADQDADDPDALTVRLHFEDAGPPDAATRPINWGDSP